MEFKYKSRANVPSDIFPITTDTEIINEVYIHGEINVPTFDVDNNPVLDNNGEPVTEKMIWATIKLIYYQSDNKEIIKTVRRVLPLATWGIIEGINPDGTFNIDEVFLSNICASEGYTYVGLV